VLLLSLLLALLLVLLFEDVKGTCELAADANDARLLGVEVSVSVVFAFKLKMFSMKSLSL